MQEIQVPSLGQENALEKEMATHSNILGLENPMGRAVLWAIVHGVTESDTTEQLNNNSNFCLAAVILSELINLFLTLFPYL